MSAANCTTHHKACDCREAMFADTLDALAKVVSCFDIKDGLSVRDEQAIKHAASVIARATDQGEMK